MCFREVVLAEAAEIVSCENAYLQSQQIIGNY